MATPPPSVFSYDTADDENEGSELPQQLSATGYDTALDFILTSVLVVLGLGIAMCVLYQSRASLAQRIERFVATSSSARSIRTHAFKWRPSGASEGEMDTFDDGIQSGTRMPRIHPVNDGSGL